MFFFNCGKMKRKFSREKYVILDRIKVPYKRKTYFFNQYIFSHRLRIWNRVLPVSIENWNFQIFKCFPIEKDIGGPVQNIGFYGGWWRRFTSSHNACNRQEVIIPLLPWNFLPPPTLKSPDSPRVPHCRFPYENYKKKLGTNLFSDADSQKLIPYS